MRFMFLSLTVALSILWFGCAPTASSYKPVQPVFQAQVNQEAVPSAQMSTYKYEVEVANNLLPGNSCVQISIVNSEGQVIFFESQDGRFTFDSGATGMKILVHTESCDAVGRLRYDDPIPMTEYGR